MTSRHQRQKNPGSLSALERLLLLFAEVRAGEGISVVLLFVNILLLLTAYYILKVVREQLTISGVSIFGLPGDEIKAYLPAVMAVLLVVVVPAYGRIASKVSRLRLIKLTSAFVVCSLIVFFFWGRTVGIGTAIGLVFYIWLGIVSIFLVAQFWSYANDIYTESQGKRLFAIIAIGQSAGAIIGPQIAKAGANFVFTLLLVVALIFVACLALYIQVDRRSDGVGFEGGERDKPLNRDGGFELVFQTRYLFYIALMILATNVVNTTGEYILSNAAKRQSVSEVPHLPAEREHESRARADEKLAHGDFANIEKLFGHELAVEIAYEQAFANAPLPRAERRAHARIDEGRYQRLSILFGAPLAEEIALHRAYAGALKRLRGPVIGRFYGDFFSLVNLVGLLIQMFLVSRIFKYAGIRVALFILPVISLGGYAAIGIVGGLAVLRISKTAENATDYSLQNTLKQALFLPTSREAKYKAKAAIDTFFVRFGDTASAGIVFVGLHFFSLGARGFALVNVALAGVWIALAAAIAREHKKLVPDDHAKP